MPYDLLARNISTRCVVFKWQAIYVLEIYLYKNGTESTLTLSAWCRLLSLFLRHEVANIFAAKPLPHSHLIHQVRFRRQREV